MWSQTRHTGVPILNEVLRSIKLDEGLKRENNEILHSFLDGFLDEMKRVDKVFSYLYQELYYTGSFYSDLRISKPDEFDINVILNLHFNDHEFRLLASSQEPNHIRYLLNDYRKSYGNLFESGYLIPENVREWFQGIIDKALRTYTLPRTFRRVYVREAGPARTITIVKNNNTAIDVDLMPVISCTINISEWRTIREVIDKVGKTLKAFLVPKPRYADMREKHDARRLWRAHFPYAEETIIKNVGCAKSVIRLLKLLRDREKWSILSSYYLKTVVMWMIFENAGIHDFWKEDRLADRFFQALQKLQQYVEQMHIPCIFNKNCNLIEKMNQLEAFNIYNRLNLHIRHISYDIRYLTKIF